MWVKSEKTAHARLRRNPLRAAVAIHIQQRLDARARRPDFRFDRQRLGRAVTDGIGVGGVHGPHGRAVIPGVVSAVYQPRHAFAVEVEQLVSMAGERLKRSITCAVQLQCDALVQVFLGRLIAERAVGIHRLLVGGHQMGQAIAADVMFEQQAFDQHWVGPHAWLVGERVKHQDLSTQAQRALFKTVGVAGKRVLAHGPVSGRRIGRHLVESGAALPIVEYQMKVPGLAREVVGLEQVRRGFFPGVDVAVIHTVQIALGSAVMGECAGIGFGLIAIADMFAVRIEAFLQQPLRHMRGVFGVGNARREGFAVQVLSAVAGLHPPKAGGV